MNETKPREFYLPIVTLIVNSDIKRPNGTRVIEHWAYAELLAEYKAMVEALDNIREHHSMLLTRVINLSTTHNIVNNALFRAKEFLKKLGDK